MMSDALNECREEIHRYLETMPEVYRQFRSGIEVVLAALATLQGQLDRLPGGKDSPVRPVR